MNSDQKVCILWRSVCLLMLAVLLYCAVQFSAAEDEEEITDIYEVMDVEVGGSGFIYSDSMLTETDPNTFSTDLVKMSVTLAAAAYNRSNTESMLSAIGYKTYPYQYEEQYSDSSKARTLEDNDHVAFVIGKKRLKGYNTTLYIVAVRGTALGPEWFSDFNMGPDANGYHLGFKLAADEVRSKLNTLLDSDRNNVILFTGHSRGAAVANILAKEYTDGSNSKVFGYTFACPAVVKSNVSLESYHNIYNIINSGDIVPVFPLKSWGYKRYGQPMTINFGSQPKFKEHYFVETGSKYDSAGDSLNYETIIRTIISRESEANTPLGRIALYLIAWGIGGSGEQNGEVALCTVGFNELLLYLKEDF